MNENLPTLDTQSKRQDTARKFMKGGVFLNKARGVSIIAIILLVLQIFSPNFGLGSVSQAANSDDDFKIAVSHESTDEGLITWKLKINAASEENEGTETTVVFDKGQTHQAIDDVGDAKVEKTASGYVIETPAGNDAYTMVITSKITEESQKQYHLQADMIVDGKRYQAEEQIVVEQQVVVEQQEEAELEVEQGEPKEKATTEQEKIEKQSEAEQQEATEVEESAKEEVEEEDEVELIGAPHPPFTTTSRPNALAGEDEGDQWPAPGSLKLTKDAEATSNYAEWEVELTVEGKNLKTSSDVVLVFDRSNSMYASRLSKAKNAAKQFVDNLLIDGTSTRIALVPFGTTHDPHTDFTDYTAKQSLKNAIDAIRVTGGNDGGTNIQAGLHQAKELLSGSNADQKTIVLLSDGEPTYSFRAGNAQAHTWPGNKYNYILSNFNYSSRLGSGNSYNYSSNHRHSVNGYSVRTNGIPTLSEARHIMNSGIGIYSIGLEVGNNTNATYVLTNSQNKGYYAGGDDDLGPIFEEIAAKLNYAATKAVVTDPLGEMFDLVKDGSYNGADFVASHGVASWDETSETFTWDIGDIKEGEVYSLKYKVMVDCKKNPKGNIKYPTNKETPLHYKDSDGNSKTKQFPIPKVEVNKGKITKKGYRVNAEGDPIDSSGNVVSREAAQQFYDELFGDNLTFNSTYSVPANNVPDYTLLVGDDPTELLLTAGEVCETVWFGYVKTSELKAGDVTAKYVDEDGNEIAAQETYSGNIGDSYSTVQKDIPGYEFKEMHADSDPATGTFKKEEQTVIYVYTKKTGSLTVNKVNEKGEPLEGAEFKLTGPNGYNETNRSAADGTIIFDNLEWGDYKLVETKAPEGYNKLVKEIKVTIDGETLHVTKEVKNTPIGWDIPDTGGIGSLGFYSVGFMLITGAAWLLLRRRYV